MDESTTAVYRICFHFSTSPVAQGYLRDDPIAGFPSHAIVNLLTTSHLADNEYLKWRLKYVLLQVSLMEMTSSVWPKYQVLD